MEDWTKELYEKVIELKVAEASDYIDYNNIKRLEMEILILLKSNI